MNTSEKFLAIYNAKNDSEMSEGIDKLTDTQKKIIITALVKSVKNYTQSSGSTWYPDFSNIET